MEGGGVANDPTVHSPDQVRSRTIRDIRRELLRGLVSPDPLQECPSPVFRSRNSPFRLQRPMLHHGFLVDRRTRCSTCAWLPLLRFTQQNYDRTAASPSNGSVCATCTRGCHSHQSASWANVSHGLQTVTFCRFSLTVSWAVCISNRLLYHAKGGAETAAIQISKSLLERRPPQTGVTGRI